MLLPDPVDECESSVLKDEGKRLDVGHQEGRSADLLMREVRMPTSQLLECWRPLAVPVATIRRSRGPPVEAGEDGC